MTLCLVALPYFLIVSSLSEIVNVMCLVMPAAACLFIYLFGFFGSHYNSSVKSRLQNVKSQYQYEYWKVLTAELLELGAIFSSA